MRPPKTITVCALALVLLQTTGCHSFRPIQANFSTIHPEGMDIRERYRFTLKNWRTVDLYYVGADSLTIMGTEKRGSGPRRLPRSQIQWVEEEVTDVPRTILLTAVLAAPVVYMVASIISCSRNPHQLGCE